MKCFIYIIKVFAQRLSATTQSSEPSPSVELHGINAAGPAPRTPATFALTLDPYSSLLKRAWRSLLHCVERDGSICYAPPECTVEALRRRVAIIGGLSDSPNRFRALFSSLINISLHCLLIQVLHIRRSAFYVWLRGRILTGIRIIRQAAFNSRDHLALEF